MRVYVVVFYFSLCVIYIEGAHIEIKHPSLNLSQYGYLPETGSDSTQRIDENSNRKAIKDFQAFSGLDVTGSRWSAKDLTYKISKYPAKPAQADVDKEIQRAFNVWTEYTDLTFTPKSGPVHIEIRFEHGEHDDRNPFDGPGGIPAYAFFPDSGSDAHFDASESWSINSYRGTNLFQVAVHEFGHHLGLGHTHFTQAVMTPYYRGYNPMFHLENDDIQGIQALDGKKNRTTTTTRFGGDDDEEEFDNSQERADPSPSARNSNLCDDPKFDTIFNTDEGCTYVFKGDKFWRVTKDSVAPGYPKLIADNWPGLPGNIDAAFTYKNGKTYFFKGSKYWRYKDRKMDGTYPKDISKGFAGIPDDLDAALVWSDNEKVYFFKGNNTWEFDPSRRPHVAGTIPIPISLDAAFQWTNKHIYLFKGNVYNRYPDTFAVPFSTAYWWFGCKDASGTVGPSEQMLNAIFLKISQGKQ